MVRKEEEKPMRQIPSGRGEEASCLLQAASCAGERNQMRMITSHLFCISEAMIACGKRAVKRGGDERTMKRY